MAFYKKYFSVWALSTIATISIVSWSYRYLPLQKASFLAYIWMSVLSATLLLSIAWCELKGRDLTILSIVDSLKHSPKIFLTELLLGFTISVGIQNIFSQTIFSILGFYLIYWAAVRIWAPMFLAVEASSESERPGVYNAKEFANEGYKVIELRSPYLGFSSSRALFLARPKLGLTYLLGLISLEVFATGVNRFFDYHYGSKGSIYGTALFIFVLLYFFRNVFLIFLRYSSKFLEVPQEGNAFSAFAPKPISLWIGDSYKCVVNSVIVLGFAVYCTAAIDMAFSAWPASATATMNLAKVVPVGDSATLTLAIDIQGSDIRTITPDAFSLTVLEEKELAIHIPDSVEFTDSSGSKISTITRSDGRRILDITDNPSLLSVTLTFRDFPQEVNDLKAVRLLYSSSVGRSKELLHVKL